MQEVVDIITNAASDTGEFGRVEQTHVQSAKTKDLPILFAYNREGAFTESIGREPLQYDVDKTAEFGIYAADATTHAEVETLFRRVIKQAIENGHPIQPIDFQGFEHNLPPKVKLNLFSVQLDSSTDFDA